MPLRSSTLTALSVLTAGSLLACSSNTTLGNGGDGGNGGSGAQGGQGGEGLAPGTCEARAGDHAAVCPGRDCAITVDVEVECTDYDFAAGGVRALPAEGATYLGTTSNAPTRIFSVASDGSAELLALDVQSHALAFAVDADGRGYLAADETEFGAGDYPGGVVFAPLDGAAPKETVFDRDDKGLGVYALRIGQDGMARVWFNSDAPDGHALAIRAPDGEWSWGPASIPSGSDWEQFTLAADDTPQSFGFAELDSSHWQLRVIDGGDSAVLGSPVQDFFPRAYAVIAPPMPPASDTIPRFAAVIQHADGLRIASQTTATFAEQLLDGTALPTYVCMGGGEPPPCAADCTERSSGLEYSAFSAARTQDGRVWLAYAISHIDTTIAYAPQDIDGSQVCIGNVASDRTTSTLHLLRLDASGTAPEEVLALDLPGTAGESHFSDPEGGHPLVDVQAVGSEITVAIRLQKARGGPYVARVLRIDTTLLD